MQTSGSGWDEAWSLRASDADRQKYLDVLDQAFVEGRLTREEHEERVETAYTAKTYSDLVGVVANLPVRPGSLPGPPGFPGWPMPPQPSATQPPDPGILAPGAAKAQGAIVPVPQAGAPAEQQGVSTRSDSTVFAFFSNSSRQGQWLVPPAFQATAVFGEVTVDLRSAVLTSPETRITANAFLGSVTVIVPDSVVVQLTGNAVLGDFQAKDKRKGADRQRVPSPQAPLLIVGGVAFLGSVEVRTVRPNGHHAPLSMMTQALPSAEHPAIGPGRVPPTSPEDRPAESSSTPEPDEDSSTPEQPDNGGEGTPDERS